MKNKIRKILSGTSLTEKEFDRCTKELCDLLDVSKSVCPKCGSNKLYYSTTGKLCCTRCVFG